MKNYTERSKESLPADRGESVLDVLRKKALGYEVTEVTKEYAPDGDGTTKLVKERTSTKYFPPDVAALKTYLELRDENLETMSDEELEAEKRRLLAAFAAIKTDSNQYP